MLQVELAVDPLSVQLWILNVPVLFVVKLTVPVGVVGVDEVSVTVAVQLAALSTVSEPGEQEMVVLVW